MMSTPKDRQNSGISMAEAEMVKEATGLNLDAIPEIHAEHYSKGHTVGMIDHKLACQDCKRFW